MWGDERMCVWWQLFKNECGRLQLEVGDIFLRVCRGDDLLISIAFLTGSRGTTADGPVLGG